MLILPPAEERRRRAAAGLSRRERRLLRVIGAVAAALVIAVVASLTAHGRSTGHGCVHATFPGPVGAEQVYQCGASARQLCAALDRPGGYGGEAGRSIAVQCRKAHLPVA